jgi:ribosome-associated toxin RatA of RatAB toxin-antitoxin module
MAEQATQRTTIAAPPERCYEAVIDFEQYPRWARDIKEAKVVQRDDEGRGVEVAYRAAAMGRSTSYTLRYEYGEAPSRVPGKLVRGDLTRQLEGVNDFVPLDDYPDSTEVTYHLTVELVVPLPGFVKRRAEARIMHTALRDLKAFVEPNGSA